MLAHKLRSQRFWRTAAKSTTKKMQATSLQFLLHSKTALFFGKKIGSKTIFHSSLRASYEAEKYVFFLNTCHEKIVIATTRKCSAFMVSSRCNQGLKT